MPPPISIDELRNKLPVGKTVMQAYRLSFRYARIFLSMNWAWLLLAVVPILAAYSWHVYDSMKLLYSRPLDQPEPVPPEITLRLGIAGLLLGVAMMIPMASIAVAWHRFLLRQEVPDQAMRTDHVVMRYALLAFLFGAAVQAPSILQMLIYGGGDPASASVVVPTMLLGFLSIAIAIVLSRLTVVLPGVAVENGAATVAGAFDVTRGNTIRLAVAPLLIYLPFVLPMVPLAFLAIPRIESKIAGVAVLTGLNLVTFLGAFVLLTFLSLSYWHFYERRSAAASPPLLG